MMMSPRVDLREAIGSEWLTYIPPFAWLVPLWFSGSILSTKNLSGWTDTALVMAINLVALCACALEYLMFRITIWRRSLATNGGVTSVWVVVGGGLALGATKAIATTYLSHAFLGTELTDIAGKIVASSALGAIVVVIVPIALFQLELYRSRREQLIHEIVRREVQLDSATEKANRTLLENFIRTSLNALARVRQNPETLPAVLDDLRENEVRPLSHQIWQREQGKIPQFTLANLISISLSSGRFVIWPVVAGYLALIGPSELLGYGPASAGGALVLQSAVIVATLWIANQLPRNTLRKGIEVFIGANVFMTITLSALTNLTFGPLPGINSIQASFAALQVLLTLTLFTMVFSLTRKTHRAVEEDLLSLTPDLGQTELKLAQQSRADRELARLLHAQVQNVLLARSVQIKRELTSEKVGENERQQILERVLVELESYIRGLSPNEKPRVSVPLSAQLLKLEEAWNPVIELHIDRHWLTDNQNLESHADVIHGILDEGISNAVRHGYASRVRIQIDQEPSGLTITIDDDGAGPRKGQPGLGAMFLSAIPHSDWCLDGSSSLGGAHLCVHIRR